MEPIKSNKEIGEKTNAYRKQVEETLTKEALEQLFPRVQKRSKSIELGSFSSRDIPIATLEDMIKKLRMSVPTMFTFTSAAILTEISIP